MEHGHTVKKFRLIFNKVAHKTMSYVFEGFKDTINHGINSTKKDTPKFCATMIRSKTGKYHFLNKCNIFNHFQCIFP